MSGPTRWREEEGSPAGARELLRIVSGAARSRPLPDAARARSVARLDRVLALPAAAGLVVWMKGVAIAAGIGALGVAAVRETARPRPGTPPVVASMAPTAAPAPHAIRAASAHPVAMPPPSASVTAPPPAPPAPARASFTPVNEGRPVETDPLAREAAMLERARSLLESNPRGALAELDAHAAAFPAGRLTLERELLAVEALRRQGRVAEARARGEELQAHARGSIYEERVRAILDGLPPR